MLTLTTERLTIASLTPSDAPHVLAVLNDPDFIANVADRGVRTEEQARSYIEEGPVASYREHGFGMYAVRLRDTGEFIGLCGLVKRPQLADVDIGYGFLPAARGRGYAVEAARAVWDYAVQELGFTRLIAIVNPDNAPSIRLLEKLGLTYETDVKMAEDEAPIRQYGWNSQKKGPPKRAANT
ncbi:GNAT family N-acetyltransferase [Parahaliea aestuarii]|uniref:GNAT family N-acetyltransferase n=1 Tax=Parahaliea aestuarii TaxID=1852021 RepID=A0A5C8ZY52_9GAMM|nr:GNAT family N-acetyltransferase [Parahaliea aestuarii]TXS92634.1 GNAT family N-acetyltransferase [Parahaliea aestuarii]